MSDDQPDLPFRKPKRPRSPRPPRTRLRLTVELLPSETPDDMRERRAVKALLRFHGFKVLKTEVLTQAAP